MRYYFLKADLLGILLLVDAREYREFLARAFAQGIPVWKAIAEIARED